MACFSEIGFGGTRLQDIAERAGVTTALLYRYFPDKGAIFEATVRRFLVPSLADVESRVRARRGEPAGALREVLTAWWGAMTDPRVAALPRVVLGETHRFPAVARLYAREVVGRRHRLLRDVRAGSARHLGPVSDRAKVISDKLEFITQALRQDVEKLNDSVQALTDRLQLASERMEERIEEFNALMEVVQGEAEEMFLDTASTVRGVREGARMIAERAHERPERRTPRGSPESDAPRREAGEGGVGSASERGTGRSGN